MANIKVSQIINGNKVEIITIEVPEGQDINNMIEQLTKLIHESNYVYHIENLKGAVISKEHGPVIIEDVFPS